MTSRPSPRRLRGVSLVEVMVSLLILSVGVLGLAALQARALQQGADAEDRLRAALLAERITTEMWLRGTVSLPAGVVSDWQSQVQDSSAAGLPNATGTISSPDALGGVTVTVRWRPPSRSASLGLLQYQTRVALP
ncbi:MAG: type pilus modification protein PilV [Pseudomonadota bacterium]